MSRRREQIASALQREIGRILIEGLADPRAKGMISVTGVEVSQDRRQAVVNVSIMPEKHQHTTMQALRHARQHIQNRLADRIRARQLPRLEFKLDESLKKQARVIESINAARAETADQPEPTHDPDEISGPTEPEKSDGSSPPPAP
jgi:ribosome-binding factor A